MPDDVGDFIREVLSHLRLWTKRARVPKQDAADLVHNALVRLLEHLETVEPRARASYLRTALHHETLHYWAEEAKRRERAPLVEAHLGERDAPFPAADAETVRRELFEGLASLLEYVAPGRRTVAAWCLWASLLEGEVGLDALAEELGIERGTLGSQWARAKVEIREGLRREGAKRRGRSKAAALFLALALAWLWLVARGRRAAASLAAALPRLPSAAGGPCRALVAKVHTAAGRHGKGSSWADRAVPGAVFACALLPFALTTHAATAGAAETRPHEDATIAELAGAASAPLKEEANEDAAIAEASPAPSDRPASDSDRPRDSDPPARTPATLADGRDAQGAAGDAPTAPARGAGVRGGRSAIPPAAPGISARSADGRRSVSSSRDPGPSLSARGNLVWAYHALWQEHDRAKARRMLELYEMTFPDDPVPDQHADLVAALRALDARDARGVGLEE